MSVARGTLAPKSLLRKIERQFDELREMFLMFDKDHDGVISTMEVRTILRSLGQDPSSQQVKGAMKQFDADGNGTIEFCEFLAVMARLLQDTDSEDDLVGIFRVLDQDGDGYVSKADLREVVIRIGSSLSNTDLDEMINEADKDGDGQINFEEFVKIITARS